MKSLLEDKISNMAVGRLQVVDVEAWIARRRKRGGGEGSIRNQLQVLRAALTQAQRWGWVTQNPAALVTLTRPKRVARGVMSDDEVNEVLDAAETLGEREAPGASTGRGHRGAAGRMGALKWSDFDGKVVRIDSVLIAVRVTNDATGEVHTEIHDTPTETGDLRIVTLDPDTLDLVDKVRATYGSAGPWLFSDGPEPPHPGRVGYWWKEAKDRSGIDTTWRLHDLRHWSATHGVSEGFDMATVSGRLGHSDASTTLLSMPMPRAAKTRSSPRASATRSGGIDDVPAGQPVAGGTARVGRRLQRCFQSARACRPPDVRRPVIDDTL